jgi:hypothetical protein
MFITPSESGQVEGTYSSQNEAALPPKRQCLIRHSVTVTDVLTPRGHAAIVVLCQPESAKAVLRSNSSYIDRYERQRKGKAHGWETEFSSKKP